MAKRTKSSKAVSRTEVAAVARKLDAWGATLPPKERAVLQKMMAAAPTVRPSRINVSVARTRLASAIREVIVDVGGLGNAPEGWARIDPIWYKSNAMPTFEEIEITSKVIVKGR